MTDKEHLRDSIVFHLEQARSTGLTDILRVRPVVAKIAAEPVAIQSVSAAEDLSACQTLGGIQAVIGDCQRCKLARGRKNIVFGTGNPQTDLMFVGEGPGADEDAQGVPFVGRAGQLLTKMIEAMGRTRDDVYIANVVKCRPPDNRNPEPDEIAECLPFLKKQIELINPKVIVALGKFAAQTVCETQIPISKLRGDFRTVNGRTIMPTFHPSFLLRNPEMKRPVWEDLKKVVGFLKTTV